MQQIAMQAHALDARQRHVAYRNRPVAEYAPAALVSDDQVCFVDLGSVLRAWGG